MSSAKKPSILSRARKPSTFPGLAKTNDIARKKALLCNQGIKFIEVGSLLSKSRAERATRRSMGSSSYSDGESHNAMAINANGKGANDTVSTNSREERASKRRRQSADNEVGETPPRKKMSKEVQALLESPTKTTNKLQMKELTEKRSDSGKDKYEIKSRAEPIQAEHQREIAARGKEASTLLTTADAKKSNQEVRRDTTKECSDTSAKSIEKTDSLGAEPIQAEHQREIAARGKEASTLLTTADAKKSNQEVRRDTTKECSDTSAKSIEKTDSIGADSEKISNENTSALSHTSKTNMAANSSSPNHNQGNDCATSTISSEIGAAQKSNDIKATKKQAKEEKKFSKGSNNPPETSTAKDNADKTKGSVEKTMRNSQEEIKMDTPPEENYKNLLRRVKNLRR